ncbi:tyrosine decarboxylase [Melissococcus plutonius]|uniref:Decarboxylase, putative n=1 Tax=Melissococcus plutonius TaxID=33970 RepID=A0A2Z5Y483_9ENTE|nr:tyrosine decarboxylase [Melissococcus plutonius]BAL62647.1 tyrosine decarboxylase [Melissococcus plutonius DAT561]MCV2498572.1 tyrosine decarboxylase [Melissococcus plutonius]MCV2501779.1 tyrosine decarboxylase [Melissococcus plutonius]MCV2504760.1 tyrosine decarboxylase [Melissococcus plutonius]MCV2507220.1 tyrosine decarboxylase [Melissococcus plutonius]
MGKSLPKDLNLHALFIGDKAENGDLYKKLLNDLVDEHLGWRQNYMPQDTPVITPEEQSSENFENTVNHMKNVLAEISSRLRTDSVPWHSAGRYWGHMNSETLMPAILAYNFAILWNGNNVAYESSPATSQMEEEVGLEFAQLMSYKNGWGHIVADGSIANLEGLWYARNIKSLPLAMKEVTPELVSDKDEWALMNMSTEEILDRLEKVPDKIEEIKTHSARSGKNLEKLGKWLVPQTKHYSWLKAADIIGIGLDQVVSVPVDHNYRMDIKELERIIRELADQKIPILGVVGVVGSTEEGAVDEIDKIAIHDINRTVNLREKLAKDNIYFYLHVDAAYGGYGRAIFLDENNNFIPYNNLKDVYYENGVFTDKGDHISEEVYYAYKAIEEAESVTIDPHKMGYIPYSAGGIVIKDIRMRDVISYFATYVFEKGADIPALLGAYILEGSKAGATAASVWAAHRVLPLNISGYGKLIGSAIEGAQRFYHFLDDLSFNINGKEIEVHPLTFPDFNMVDYVFKEKGNDDLVAMNKLNHDVYDYSSYVKGSIYSNGFLTSHTDFAIPDYGNSPLKFVNNLGFSNEEWQRAGKVTILRASVMSPYMNQEETFNEYKEKIKVAIQEKLEKIYSE